MMDKKNEYDGCQSFNDYLNVLISRVVDRIEKEMPDEGSFWDIVEMFDNPDEGSTHVVGKYGLRVFKMRPDVVPDPKKRYVEACAYIPSGEYKATLMAGAGTKAEILAIIKDQKYIEQLNNTYAKLLDMLEDF